MYSAGCLLPAGQQLSSCALTAFSVGDIRIVSVYYQNQTRISLSLIVEASRNLTISKIPGHKSSGPQPTFCLPEFPMPVPLPASSPAELPFVMQKNPTSNSMWIETALFTSFLVFAIIIASACRCVPGVAFELSAASFCSLRNHFPGCEHRTSSDYQTKTTTFTPIGAGFDSRRFISSLEVPFYPS